MVTEAEITSLHAEVAAAQRRHAGAEAAQARADARAAAEAAALREEFGVATAAEVRSLMTSLEEQVAAEAAQVRAHLARAGGTQ
jgi:hypothetical protein